MPHTIQETLVNCQQVNMLENTSETCNNLPMTTNTPSKVARERGERIKLAREAAGYSSQEQLANALGIKQQSVQLWEAGVTKPKEINKLASILAVSVDWILNGAEDVMDLPYSLAARCPAISWEDAKNWPANKMQLKNEDKLDYIGNNIILKGNCYILKIKDESMINLQGQGFRLGGNIIVDPSKKHKDGDFVIVKKINFSDVILRKYIYDGQNEYFTALNLAAYPKPIDLTSEHQVCGVVVAYIEMFI